MSEYEVKHMPGSPQEVIAKLTLERDQMAEDANFWDKQAGREHYKKEAALAALRAIVEAYEGLSAAIEAGRNLL